MQLSDFYSSPEEAGINQKRLDILRTRTRKEIDEGLLPSAQIAIAKNGKVVWNETFGDANNDSLYPVFSCTKAIVSAAAWVVDSGRIAEHKRGSRRHRARVWHE